VDESTLPPPDKSADGIGVFDVAQNKMLRKVPGGSDPEQFAVAPDGKLLYVTNEDAAGLSLVDPANGQVLKTLPTGREPEGVTLSPDGKQIFVTSEDEGTVTVVGVASASVIKKIKVGRRPRNVAFMPDGSRAYVHQINGQVAVLNIDANHNVTDSGTRIATGGSNLGYFGVEQIATDATGLVLVHIRAASTGGDGFVAVIDPATNSVIGIVTIPNDSAGGGIAAIR